MTIANRIQTMNTKPFCHTFFSNHYFKRWIHIKKNFFPDEVAHSKYEHYTSAKRRKNLKILFDNTTIIPFKWRGKYLCFHCDLSTADYHDIKKHTRSHGPCSTQDYSLRLIKGSHNEVKLDISDITCEICNEQFTSLDDILNHLIDEHGLDYDKSIDIAYEEYYLADLHCQYCGEQFEYFRFLSTHINKFHPKNCFMCDDCGLTFNKKRDMTDHIRRNHRRGGYPCDECSEVFEAQSLLRKHKNDFHFRKCKTCRSSFASLSLLRKHIQLEHSVTGIKKCPHCAREFQTKLGMIQHLRNCKVKVIVKREKPATFPRKVVLIPRRTQNLLQIRQNILCVLNMSTAIPFKFFAKFSCFYCSTKFTDFEELKEHTSLQHPVCDLKSKSITKCKGERTCVRIDVKSLACKVCGRHVDSLDTLIEHLISRHKANYDPSFNECFEPFKMVKDNIPCPHCSKIFRYFATLIRHINSEHSSNRKICDFCGRCFKNAANLKVHIGYSHLGTCECDVCGLKFKNVWCLGRHKAKSHDVKDFKCPKCPEQFQSQYHKQKHLIQVHDIGHKCSYCDRMFTRNSFMKDHIRRTHLKEKNVPCSVCNEKFFDNHLLKLHMVKHDGERKFSCNVCGKAFLRRSNLCSHMDMHKKYGHVVQA